MTISKNHVSAINTEHTERETTMDFILEHVAKILDWTKDGYEAGIIRAIADIFKK